jgi:hypothetical protein
MSSALPATGSAAPISRVAAAAGRVSVPEMNPHRPFQTGLTTAALWFAP